MDGRVLSGRCWHMIEQTRAHAVLFAVENIAGACIREEIFHE